MSIVLGIDLGTSSIKAMLLDTEGGVLGTAMEEHDVIVSSPGYGEQNPEQWWQGLLHVLSRLRERFPREYQAISAVGYSGQMHGLVMVDQRGKPVRPAILWMDQRSEKQCEEIRNKVPYDLIQERLHNRIFPGFAFPSLMWVKEQEPENYRRIYKVMQPKDYIRYRMTGEIGAEVSDASASLMFDVGKRAWAREIMETCGISGEIFPSCFESMEIQGEISQECRRETGLPEGAAVVYGAGDQQAQSIGNGIIKEGDTISNIGTGGQISVFSARDIYDKRLRTHTFCHGIPGSYTIFGAILNAGLSTKWMKNQVIKCADYEALSHMAEQVPPGSEGVIFLPYLTGERTPHMDSRAKAMFWGLQLHHGQEHLARAVMEGVTFALKDCLTIIEELGIQSTRIIASGGGAKSPVWLQMQADIFQREVVVSKVSEQACLGACLMAATGTGSLHSLEEGCRRFVEYDTRSYVPGNESKGLYEEQFDIYREIYQQVKPIFRK